MHVHFNSVSVTYSAGSEDVFVTTCWTLEQKCKHVFFWWLLKKQKKTPPH